MRNIKAMASRNIGKTFTEIAEYCAIITKLAGFKENTKEYYAECGKLLNEIISVLN